MKKIEKNNKKVRKEIFGLLRFVNDRLTNEEGVPSMKIETYKVYWESRLSFENDNPVTFNVIYNIYDDQLSLSCMYNYENHDRSISLSKVIPLLDRKDYKCTDFRGRMTIRFEISNSLEEKSKKRLSEFFNIVENLFTETTQDTVSDDVGEEVHDIIDDMEVNDVSVTDVKPIYQ